MYHGEEEIRCWVEPQLPVFHVRTWDHQTKGDTDRRSGELTADLLCQMGQTEPVAVNDVANVRDGKIVSFIITNRSVLAEH